MQQPSRRPQATAFQPVNGTSHNNNTNTNANASPSLEDRFAGLAGNTSTANNNNARKSNNNNNNTLNDAHEGNSPGSNSNENVASTLDPAKFSVTVRGNDMSSKLSSITNRLMAQIKTVTTLRDTFENTRENFVSQKICTLARQLESLYSEASDVIALMASEEPKMMPSKGQGKKNDHGKDQEHQHEEQNKNTVNINIGASPNNSNNRNNANIGNNDNNSNSSPSSILSLLQQHQQQNSNTSTSAVNNNVMKGSRRPVAVPFSQQNRNNNNQDDDTSNRTPPLHANTSSSSAMYLPGIANLDINSNNNTSNNTHGQSAIQLLQQFQQNNQGNQQQNNNKPNQGYDLSIPTPQSQQQPAPKFVRATTVITQAEQQQQQSGLPLDPYSNEHHSGAAVITPAANANTISAHQANLQGLNANGEQTFPGNPHRRLNRGEAHHFCVVEFKCNRMKRYPFDKSIDNVRPGHYVICWGDKGEDCGLCVMTGFCDETGAHSDMKTFRDANVELHKVRILSDIFILRNASREEVATLHGSLAKLEEAALQRCQEMAAQRGLTMRFTDCEIQFDRQKFTFYFDACSSVDFRDLTRDLHRIFKARIWLENINGNVKNVVPEGAISQSDKKMFAARGVQLKFR